MKFVSLEEAVAVIKSGDGVFVHSVAASPQRLVGAMTARAPELRGVEVKHLHTEGDAPYAQPEHRDLGVHTEMFSDGVIPLVESGVINGARFRRGVYDGDLPA